MNNASPSITQTAALEQKVLIRDSLLDIPVLLVDKTLQALFKDPAAFESKLSELANNSSTFSGPQTDRYFYYSRLFRQLNNLASSNVSTPSDGIGIMGDTIEQFEPSTGLPAPDITYDVRGFGSFSMLPADHFQPAAPALELIQLPTRLIPFARWLMGQKNWIVQTLHDCYFAIGKHQAAFLVRPDPRNLLELPLTHIPHRLNLPYHVSTYFRLLNHRSIKIATDGKQIVLPISCLLPTKTEVSKYYWIPKFNQIMKDELASKTAVSDDDISVLIRGVARRTIAKHREAANIPALPQRQKSYDDGRNTPYIISLPIELFLQET
jgi:hypothetical protein